jgi:hypothetical protein
MEGMKKKTFPPALCLICGVDSGPIRMFLFVFMGGLVLSSVLFLLWAYGTRRFNGDEKFAWLPIEAENEKEKTDAARQ